MMDGLWEKALDLNTPRAQVERGVQQMMAMRDKLLASYGIAAAPAAPHVMPPVVKRAQPVVGGGGEDVDWKSKLMQLTAKRSRAPPTKGLIEYEVVGSTQEGFTATTSSSLFADSYTGETAATKRAAEHSASQVALLAEFPEGAEPSAPPAQPRGQKRAFGEVGGALAMGPDPKSQLMQAMQLLQGGPVAKGDVMYESVITEEGTQNYVATVTLPKYDPEATFEGQVCEGKKVAENSAAEAAMEGLASVIESAREVHNEKKAQKAVEWAAKKAEREAEREMEEAPAL